MLITVNQAFAGGPGAQALAKQLADAIRGDGEGSGGKRWSESKPKAKHPPRRPV